MAHPLCRCGKPGRHLQGEEWFCCDCFSREIGNVMLLLDRARGQLEKLKALAAALAQELK